MGFPGWFCANRYGQTPACQYPALKGLLIRSAKGDYISPLSSDDVFHPHKLQRQVEYLDAHAEVLRLSDLVQRVLEFSRLTRCERATPRDAR